MINAQGSKSLLPLLVCGATVFATAVCAGLPAKGCWFTGPDTFLLIRSSRVGAFQDVLRILSKPLGCSEGGKLPFYRPVSTFSYSLDYALWKLNPVGFHATNILLHALVVAALCVFVYLMVRGMLSVAWFAAVLFVLHPVAAERVYAVDERQDILLSLMMLASLILFHGYLWSVRRRSAFYVGSVAFAVLATLTKETAIVLPLLIGAYAWLLGPETDAAPGHRGRGALVRTVPFFLVAAGYFVLRWSIIGGLGGYGTPFTTENVSRVVSVYCADLVCPVLGHRVVKGHDIGALAWLTVFFAVMVVGLLLALRKTEGRKAVISALRVSRLTGACWFLFLWILLPACVYVPTLTAGHQLQYFPSMAVCAILSLTTILSVRGLAKGGPGTREAPLEGGRDRGAGTWKWLGLAASTGCLMLVVQWALVDLGSEYRARGEFNQQWLSELLAAVPEIQPGAQLTVQGVPRIAVSRPERAIPDIWHYGLKSWLVLNGRGRDFTVAMEKPSRVVFWPRKFRLQTVLEGKDITVVVEFEGVGREAARRGLSKEMTGE